MKLTTYTLLVLFLLTCSPHFSQAQCVSDEGNVFAFVYNGNSYEIVKENLNWVDAAACAVERGGFLMEVNDKPEQDSVYARIALAGISSNSTVASDGGPAEYLWIGGTDLGAEGEWIWDGNNDGTGDQFWQGTASGSAVGGLYNKWGNEPDNFANQDGLAIAIENWPNGVAGEWNDLKVANDLYYIIEYNGLSTATPEPTWKSKVKIYPNPASDFFQVEIAPEDLNGKNLKVQLYNASGIVVREFEDIKNDLTIGVEGLSQGVYFIRIQNEKREGMVKPIVVE